MRIHLRTAEVEEIIEETEKYQLLKLKGRSVQALCYKELTGRVFPSEKVIINTTATDLSLGTGGYDFVVSILREGEYFIESETESHVMKLNYTPIQFATPHFEETDDYKQAVEEYRRKRCSSKVFVLTIHSHLIPFFVASDKFSPGKKGVLIVNDSSALPVFTSKTIDFLKRGGFVKKIISAYNSFGGDIETVNIYSALIAAAYAFDADFIVIAPGYGLKGTGSSYGHSAQHFTEAINASLRLSFETYLIPRISLSESRSRHFGISHHTAEVYEMCLRKPSVVIPDLKYLDEDSRSLIRSQLEESFSDAEIIYVDATKAAEALLPYKKLLRSMGRGFDDDPLFFLTPAAAAFLVGG
jgi:hypothetical protein